MEAATRGSCHVWMSIHLQCAGRLRRVLVTFVRMPAPGGARPTSYRWSFGASLYALRGNYEPSIVSVRKYRKMIVNASLMASARTKSCQLGAARKAHCVPSYLWPFKPVASRGSFLVALTRRCGENGAEDGREVPQRGAMRLKTAR